MQPVTAEWASRDIATMHATDPREIVRMVALRHSAKCVWWRDVESSKCDCGAA